MFSWMLILYENIYFSDGHLLRDEHAQPNPPKPKINFNCNN